MLGAATLLASTTAAAATSARTQAAGAPMAVVAIGDTSVAPVSAGTETVEVPVTLSGSHRGAATVRYATGNGSAVAGRDFTATSGTLRFDGTASGDVGASISIRIKPLAAVASPISFSITLSHATGAVIASATGTVTILATSGSLSDAPRSSVQGAVSVGDVTAYQAESGVDRHVAVPITLAAPASRAVEVKVETVADTASPGVDYKALATSIRFTPGQVEHTVEIDVTAEPLPQATKLLLVKITSATNATITSQYGDVVLVSFAPSSIVTTLAPSLDAIPLTTDRSTSTHAFDTFSITSAAGDVTSEGNAKNVSGNTRIVFWPAAEAPSLDQQTCATWIAQTPANGTHTTVQEGLAMRVSTVDGVTRAITITKNVWGYANYDFDVILWDTDIPGDGFDLIADVDLSSVFLDDGAYAALPWSICARVVGAAVSFEVWPSADTQPAWGATSNGTTVTIPSSDVANWSVPGDAGWYVGHLGALQSATYGDLTEEPLEQ